MTNDQNVVALEEHRQPPALLGCDLRLRVNGATRRIVLTTWDEHGNYAVLHFALEESVPADFDLTRLDAAWAIWRETSEIAS